MDGLVNVKSSAEKRNNISEKLENGFVVYCFEPKENWVNIDYKKNGKELNGYIHKDRIKYISDFTNIPLQSNLNGKVKLESENVKIEISETKFIKEKHDLKFYKNGKSILEKIDNFKIFGTDGEILYRRSSECFFKGNRNCTKHAEYYARRSPRKTF